MDDHNQAWGQEAQNAKKSWPEASQATITLLNRGVPNVFMTSLPSLNQFLNPNQPVLSQTADPHQRISYTMEWNAGIQQQLTNTMVLTVNYVGSVGRHQYIQWNVNTAAIPGPGSLASRGERWPQYNGVYTWDSDPGIASYNALQVELKKTTSYGLTFMGSYTYSKSLDEQSDPYGGTGIQDAYNLRNSYGPSDYDIRQLFVFSSVYALPVGKGKSLLSGSNRFVQTILGDWNLGAIVTLRSGFPFICNSGGDTANVGGGTQRCDEIGNPYGGTNFVKGPSSWINKASFTTIPYTFGTESRNDLRGPSYKNIDFDIYKNFHLREKVTFQLRGEFFNLFNRTDYLNPTSSFHKLCVWKDTHGRSRARNPVRRKDNLLETMTRRTFLYAAGSAAVAVAANPRIDWKQQPLEPGEITLGADVFGERFRLDVRRTFAIPIDDLLLPFFRAKGLSNGGKELNGEYAAKVQTGIWPGLYSTFWMSGAAHAAKWSKDPSHKETLARFVHELAKTREPDGFLLALGRDPGHRWAHSDLYALVRSMVRGLLDIYEATGDKLALDMARGQMDCLYKDLAEHRPAGGGVLLKGTEGRPPVTSYYKLLPALSQLYLHTGDERYLELANMCVDLPMLDDLIAGKRDPLPGRHASTWTDFLLGVYQIGLATGNQRYTQAALNAFKLIRERHLFITGSMSSGEHWRDGRFGWQLQDSDQAQETCCAGIWIAFLQNLLHGTGGMAEADCIEQAAYNDLFAAQDPERGDFCYFLNLEGDDKPFDAPPARAYHCCDGNGTMGIARLPGLVYGKTPDGIAVNLYATSEADTQIAGGRVRISQTGNYPVSGTVTIRLDPDRPRRFVLGLRIPFWTAARPGIELNGERIVSTGRIEREWRPGDTLRLKFPMGPTVLEDNHLGVNRIALRWGPTVLAGVWDDSLPVSSSREVPPYGAKSAADIWPSPPSVILSGKASSSIHRVRGQEIEFEAEALAPAVLHSANGDLKTLSLAVRRKPEKVIFRPFYSVTRGKYSVWLPAVQKG